MLKCIIKASLDDFAIKDALAHHESDQHIELVIFATRRTYQWELQRLFRLPKEKKYAICAVTVPVVVSCSVHCYKKSVI